MEKLISGIFSLLLGTAGLWTGWRQLKNRSAFGLWKTTKGKVIERGTFQPKSAMSTPAFRHAPLVRYVYQVEGREFTNDSIYPKRIQLPPHSSLKWAQKKASEFPEEVVVHYNPEDPPESYLVLTSRALLWLVVVVSILLLLIGLIVLLI